MPTSSNGWTVLTEAPPRVLIPGTGDPGIRLTIRPGDVATVLAYVAGRFHAEVEKLDVKVVDRGKVVPTDDWGWAYRPVRGQSRGFSNHASATAIDLNAVQHPRGVPGTFTAEEKRRVRRILASTYDSVAGRNVVRWGEDFTTVVDSMHFEINADSAAVARVARRIREKDAEKAVTKPVILTPPAAKPTPEVGMFLAHVPGAADTRIFLVTGEGKRHVPTPAVWRELRDTCGVPDRGEVSVAVLDMFPTLPTNATAILPPTPRTPEK